MKLTFHGGAKSVTGANYLLEAGGLKILVDCGLSQGSGFSEELNYEAFKYDPSTIDCLFLTHSHADHMGRLPKLFKDGFRGPIYATEPTADITQVALPDTLDKIKEEAKNGGHEPLYGKEDVRGIADLFKGVPYRENIVLNENVSVMLRDASHILGSSLVEFTVREEGKTKKIVFTGDLGNPPNLLLNDIDYPEDPDYVVIESAYGDRLHEDREERQIILERAIEDTVTNGGVLMIPSFAIERTQQLLLEMDDLMSNNRIPSAHVFVDSPLAINITKVYGKYSHYFNPEAIDLLRTSRGIFNFPWLKFTSNVQESKKINDLPAPKIILAGSGMSQGGRILHHESRYLPGPNNMILFVGYQVAGSLGRRIMEGEDVVKIFGQHIPVRCHVRTIEGYSAHADQNDLVKFVARASTGGNLKKVFVVQGEENASEAVALKMHEQITAETFVPSPGDSFEL